MVFCWFSPLGQLLAEAGEAWAEGGGGEASPSEGLRVRLFSAVVAKGRVS